MGSRGCLPIIYMEMDFLTPGEGGTREFSAITIKKRSVRERGPPRLGTDGPGRLTSCWSILGFLQHWEAEEPKADSCCPCLALMPCLHESFSDKLRESLYYLFFLHFQWHMLPSLLDMGVTDTDIKVMRRWSDAEEFVWKQDFLRPITISVSFSSIVATRLWWNMYACNPENECSMQNTQTSVTSICVREYVFVCECMRMGIDIGVKLLHTSYWKRRKKTRCVSENVRQSDHRRCFILSHHLTSSRRSSEFTV